MDFGVNSQFHLLGISFERRSFVSAKHTRPHSATPQTGAVQSETDSVMVEISQPAQEGREPETVGAWRVAPEIGNG
jgi:hypothetical protein